MDHSAQAAHTSISASVEALSAGGALASALPQFRERSAQLEMAAAVEAAINGSDTLVVEAGTGVGKTFAYLVPALLSGHRVIVSTGTRHLQDQLFHKDLPVLRAALNQPVDARLLKGRSNYLCLHRLELALSGGISKGLASVQRWGQRTTSGDLAELSTLSEDSPLIPRVTSTVDNCLGSECPRYQDCFLVKARRAAQQADLLVINHHVLLADLVLKEEGFGELLPSADALIIDEAHQLAETAAQFFGKNLGSRQLEGLIRDASQAERSQAAESRQVNEAAQSLQTAISSVERVLPAAERGAWPEQSSAFDAAIEAMQEALGTLAEALLRHAERSPDLRACARRANEYHSRIEVFAEREPESVRWYERGMRGFSLRSTPLNVDGLFSARMQTCPGAWIFTSATLTVDGSFRHFQHALGIDKAHRLALDSPYDYAAQALLYLPRGLPDPQHPDYTRALIEVAMPAIAASGGSAFLLFTSHRALREAGTLLNGRFEFPLLIQGEAPRRELLRRFREAGNAVLLGAASFWEGVDVRGPALRLVVIDKLPFASPGDPMTAARMEALRQRGENPFMDYQLPQAVIMLKQGVGRLIRDEQDAGVLMVCDPRLLTRPYGRIFLNSLPPMPLTREASDVDDFFRLRHDIETAGA